MMSELSPQEQQTVDTYNTVAARWASGHDTHTFWEKEIRRFQELLPGGTILEIGSGGARDARILIGLGYNYIGTDVSTGLIQEAQKALPGQQFLLQSVYDLDFPLQQFDGFWSAATLLHIPKSRIDEALQRIKTVVKAGAIGFISLKDGDSEEMVTTEENGAKLKRFFAYWRKDEFSETLQRNGYELVDYTYHPMDENTNWHGFFVRVPDSASH